MRKILDKLFLGYFLGLPRFSVYLVLPTIFFSVLQFIGVGITDTFLLYLTWTLLPITIIGFIYFLSKTIKH